MLWCSHDTEWQMCQGSSVSAETATRLENQGVPSGFLEVFMALRCTTIPFRNFFIFTTVKTLHFIQTSETQDPWYGKVIRLLHLIPITAFITQTSQWNVLFTQCECILWTISWTELLGTGFRNNRQNLLVLKFGPEWKCEVYVPVQREIFIIIMYLLNYICVYYLLMLTKSTLWGHPECSAPSSVQFPAIQPSNTQSHPLSPSFYHSISLLSFSIGNPSPLTAPNRAQFSITVPQKEYSFYLPRLPNLPTNHWQGRLNSEKSV